MSQDAIIQQHHFLEQTKSYADLHGVLARLVEIWPAHAATLSSIYGGIDNETLDFLNGVAARIVHITGDDLTSYLEDYKWTCGLMLQCEMVYRRNQKYENENFQDVLKNLYKGREDMTRYMRGLMMSQLLWRQHILPLDIFTNYFMPSAPDNARYLEIGPGHGLWMASAADIAQQISLTGWDISEHSLRETQKALDVMGVTAPANLQVKDICAPQDEGAFDIIVVSQVLEIVSDPLAALQNLKSLLSESGTIFLNAPVRAAAPDHIRRWQSDEEIADLCSKAGLQTHKDWRFGARAGYDNSQISEREGFAYVALITHL